MINNASVLYMITIQNEIENSLRKQIWYFDEEVGFSTRI